ncbi:MAG: sulfatase-like hydrolase/transferase [Nitrospirae bacterium]|nr:sulfatase-like hydrolase/transferase [Nitrospirota bacterium]
MILFLLLQQGQRGFLFSEALTIEVPDLEILLKTAMTGFRADAIVSTLAVGFAALLAWCYLALRNGWSDARRMLRDPDSFRGAFRTSSWMVGGALMLVLMVDMGYYHYAHTHLDFVFFEFIEDLIFPREQSGVVTENTPAPNQALQQTGAELQEIKKWSWIVAGFFGVEILLTLGWWIGFRTLLSPLFTRCHSLSPTMTRYFLVLCLTGGLMGFNWYGPWGIQRANITNSVYYMLAQNPLWHAGEVGIGSVFYRLSGATAGIVSTMPMKEAVIVSQSALGHPEQFLNPQYPLLRHTAPQENSIKFKKPVNVLLLFVEGLDRRYLGQAINVNNPSDLRQTFFNNPPPTPENKANANTSSEHIRLTPFLDRLGTESIYFDRFFSNGDMTARALFSTLCSYYPRRGWAVMRARYTHEFLCFPEVLKQAGYWTEMVVGQNRDRNYDHIALFLARNGIHQFLDENSFPPDAQKLGLGLTDESLFDFVYERVKDLRKESRPYFLSTLTVGTHHPYQFPMVHPDLEVLQKHPDQYVPALRYLDLALERFFAKMQKEDLFKDTMVLVLGDHGRHEGIGGSDPAARGSHFLVPFYIWIDPSLESDVPTRSKVISHIASQVDIGPTILAMNNLTPAMAPFLGQDLSCAFHTDCLANNIAFVSGAHDDAIGIVNQDFMWLYRFKVKTFFRTSLDGQHPEQDPVFSELAPELSDINSPLYKIRQQMFGLYVSSNVLLEEGQIWSKKEFAKEF